MTRFNATHTFNSDDGAQTFQINSDVYRHQLSVDCSEVVGTFDVAARPLGSSEYKTIAGALDLSASNTEVALWEGFYSEIRVTPNGVAASTDYTVAYAGGPD